MRDQAIELHGYQPGEIRVAGVPQFDGYFRSLLGGQPGLGRDAFFRAIGADPSRRLVTVTTTPRELYPHHDHVLRVLMAAIAGGRFPHPTQVLVRLHPRDDIDAYREFAATPHLLIEKPFRQTVTTGDGLAVDIMPEHQRHLADTMRHSDVVVNVASTIAIEASIFDTPVVNVAFDGEAPSEFARSARRYYRFTHYTNITRHQPSAWRNSPSSWSNGSAGICRIRPSIGPDAAPSSSNSASFSTADRPSGSRRTSPRRWPTRPACP